MNLTERQLLMFSTTAAMGNVSRAAASLHITQPALTRALREFEVQLGVKLLRRSGRGIALTHEGEQFVPVAQRLLGEMRHAVEALREQAKGLAGSVSLACGAAFGCAVLPAALLQFSRSHPRVRVRLIEDDSAGVVARAARGDADLGIGSLVGDTAALECELLMRSALGLLGDARRFKLATPLTDSAVRALPLLKEAPGTSILHALRSRGSALVSQMEAGVEVASLPMQLALARAGVGVAVVSSLAASHPAAAGLSFVPLKPKLVRELYLLHSRGRDLSPSARALQQVLRQAATLPAPPPPPTRTRTVRSTPRGTPASATRSAPARPASA